MVHQSCLCYKDLTLRNSIVSSTGKCQTRTNDNLEKCVHSVVLLCSICQNLYRTMSIRGQHQLFVFIWRKLLLNHTDYFEKLMVKMFHHKRYVWTMVSAFRKWWLRHKTERKTRNMENRQKIEEVELQALIDEDDSQKQLVDQLGISQQAVSNRLQEMGKIQKTHRRVLHELNDRQMETCKNACDNLFARYKRKSFWIV